MNLTEIQSRLLSEIRQRIHNGELTERGFARFVGISQSHIHKVLKGAQRLSTPGFDLILKCLNYSILDLCTGEELHGGLDALSSAALASIDLPFQQFPIGPGSPWHGGVFWDDRYPVPCSALSPHSDWALVRLYPDASMQFSASGFNIAVLDLAAPECAILPDHIYAVDRPDDTVLRTLRFSSAGYYLVSDQYLNEPTQWELLRLSPHQRKRVVRGRVVWFGREQPKP